MSSTHYLFCDASYHPQLKIGVGGYLILQKQEMEQHLRFPDQAQDSVQMFKLMDTDTTSLEIITVITALESYKAKIGTNNCLRHGNAIIYTDCQTICRLQDRRDKLVARNFKSQKTGEFLNKHLLYRKLYSTFDELSPEVVWLKGHSPSKSQNDTQKIFSIVDRTVRRQLRIDAKSM